MEEFLVQLLTLWQNGDAQSTHSKEIIKIRDWRTRKDPFKEGWVDVLHRLQKEPDTTAEDLFKLNQQDYPERFTKGHLRTLHEKYENGDILWPKNFFILFMLGYKTGDDNIFPIGVKG